MAVTTSDSQLREPVFGSSCYNFETWAISLNPCCSSSLSCMYEYMASENGGYVNEQSPAVIAVKLNASQRCRVGVGMNRSATG